MQIPRNRISLLCLLLLLCSIFVGRAFVPSYKSTRPAIIINRWLRSTATSSEEEVETAQLEDPLHQTGDNDNKFHLKIDPEGNALRLNDKVLLNGLSPVTWSSSSSTQTTDSLFLHTDYPAAKAEYENKLGDLIACSRILACARVTRYWMGPAFGNKAEDIPFDTQFLLVEMEKDKGPYALMLPLVDNGFRASLYYDSSRKRMDVVCAAESGDASVTTSSMRALYVAVGDDPYALLKKGFAEVSEATGSFQTLDKKKLPPSVDNFGWCTWDAFYSRVTPEGVLEGVKTLRDIGTPPRTIILDDGWQQTNPKPPEPEDVLEEEVKDKWSLSGLAVRGVAKFYDTFVRTKRNGSKGNRLWKFMSKTILKSSLWDFFNAETDFNRQLSGFDPNSKFQSEDGSMSLKKLVTELKDKLGVKHVFCWHALHGYWRGISPELGKSAGLKVTNLIPKPSKNLLRLEPQLAWDTVSLFGVGLLSNKEDLKKFYEKLHTPLVDAGVDGVKVDVQSGVSAVGGGVGGGPHLAKLYTTAMEESVAKRFPAENGASNCINCMCHSTENLYRYATTSVARASDDFYPDRPDAHTVHLVNVAYNSLFLGEICLPDWDMFHSLHVSAGFHAAARAVGGCPVYVSDKPGKHDAEVLKKLVLPDGKVLRAKLPGRPTRDCLFVDVAKEPVALKIWNQNSNGGVVGAFNVQGVAWNFNTHQNEVLTLTPPPATAKVKPHDIETLRNQPGPFAAWSHQSNELRFLLSGESLVVKNLDHKDWDIFTIVPIQRSDNLLWGPIGLTNMLNSGGAVLGAPPPQRDTDSSVVARVSCRGPGRFVAFSNRMPSSVSLEDGSTLDFAYDKEKSELSIDLPSQVEDLAHLITIRWI